MRPTRFGEVRGRAVRARAPARWDGSANRVLVRAFVLTIKTSRAGLDGQRAFTRARDGGEAMRQAQKASLGGRPLRSILQR